MSLLLFILTVMIALAAGYGLYGRWLAGRFQLSDTTPTPAQRYNDGVDFSPTPPAYLMGQHFSAIAAAGPIVGPIVACLTFGWLPCVLWIVLGVVFIGAVHDFCALVASVRHDARSIAEIARQQLGRRAWLALAGFIWLSLLYVIVAFTDVTAQSFIGTTAELTVLKADFNRGGAVAAASVLYLSLALVMGITVRRFKPSLTVVTGIFVPATLGVIWLGTKVSTLLILPVTTWHGIILGYCFIASLLPVWLLQQPRGYLGGFVLYLALVVAVVGLAAGGFEIQQPAVITQGGTMAGWLGAGADAKTMTNLMFPFLFVTIACGACSGFHGLVCGGTTSKQIAREPHCRPIAFGSMLLEGLVAVIALSTVMIIPAAEQARLTAAPAVIYGEGLAQFVTVLLGEQALLFAQTFGTMAVATFVFDTLDVATRLGRYLLQEISGAAGTGAGLLAAFLTAALPYGVLLTAGPGSWKQYWALFGASNQLLAGLTLLSITLWLYQQGKTCWFTLLPTIFIMTTTSVALTLQIASGGQHVRRAGFTLQPALVNGGVAAILLALAAFFTWEALCSRRRRAG